MTEADTRCHCGEPIVRATYDSSRGILIVRTNRTEAPLETECLNGHHCELWLEHDDAMAILKGVITVPR